MNKISRLITARLRRAKSVQGTIRLADRLDTSDGGEMYKVGPALWAKQVAEGEWDLKMDLAKNWVGCDTGDGIPCWVLGLTPDFRAIVTIVQEEGDIAFGFTFAIDERYVGLGPFED